jgi:hypothetical protein
MGEDVMSMGGPIFWITVVLLLILYIGWRTTRNAERRHHWAENAEHQKPDTEYRKQQEDKEHHAKTGEPHRLGLTKPDMFHPYRPVPIRKPGRVEGEMRDPEKSDQPRTSPTSLVHDLAELQKIVSEMVAPDEKLVQAELLRVRETQLRVLERHRAT